LSNFAILSYQAVDASVLPLLSIAFIINRPDFFKGPSLELEKSGFFSSWALTFVKLEENLDW